MRKPTVKAAFPTPDEVDTVEEWKGVKYPLLSGLSFRRSRSGVRCHDLDLVILSCLPELYVRSKDPAVDIHQKHVRRPLILRPSRVIKAPRHPGAESISKRT
jgi:hypothetical protein